MVKVLGDTHQYLPGTFDAREVSNTAHTVFDALLGLNGSKQVEVYDGLLERKGNNPIGAWERVFYPDQEDLSMAEEYGAQVETEQAVYSLDEFLETYDLGGTVSIMSESGEERKLLDTEERTLNTDFSHDHEAMVSLLDAPNYRRNGCRLQDDTESALLASIMREADATEYTHYDTFANAVDIVVNEVQRRDPAEFRNTAKPADQ